MGNIIEHTVKWENIDIQIIHKPDYFASVGVGHLEVKANQPLPFTDTGYRSIWLMCGELGERSVQDYVLQALEHDSKQKKWKDYLKKKKISDMEKTQLSFF